MSFGSPVDYVSSFSRLSDVIIVIVAVVVVESQPSIGAGSRDDDAVPLSHFDAASGANARGAGAAIEAEFHEGIDEDDGEEIAHRVTMLRVEHLLKEGKGNDLDLAIYFRFSGAWL